MDKPMTNAQPGPDAVVDSPSYAEGMAYFQTGEFAEAIRCFEALARQYPGSLAVSRALEEARFKARLDARSRVKGRRWIIPWRPLLLRSAIVLAIGVAALMGFQLITRQVAPAVAQAQEQRRLEGLSAEGDSYLKVDKLDEAQAAFEAVLAAVPEDAGARAGLAQVSDLRQRQAAYNDAAALQAGGDLNGALGAFAELSLRWPGYRDVGLRITDIRSQLDIEQLFSAADADFSAGRCSQAVTAYQQISNQNATYQRELISERLFACYMRLGRELIERNPPAPELVPQALEYFSLAASLRPRDPEATMQQRLASLYQAGRAEAEAGRWEPAVTKLEPLYADQPGYLGGQAAQALYDAYVHNGDRMADGPDCPLAWEQYRRASLLPVGDNSLAVARQSRVQMCLTPTPTPTNTPTPTPIPTLTPYIYVPPTEFPSATPPAPLASYRNQIIFMADKQDQYGFWVMNPDGSSRRYLGPASKTLLDQYAELIKRDQLSPDGQCQVYTTQGEADKFAQIYIKCQGNKPGEVWIRQLTHRAGTTYDPVWAPDGSRIAFVSQEYGSDDVWVVDPDGTNSWDYTRNEWEWDKHPSFSPDSRKIVFWSNREGTKQIFVMDADGRNLKKIFATTWDEYDPIWVK